MASDKRKAVNHEARRLLERIVALEDRCLWLERFACVVGGEFQKTHLDEQAARRWAERANVLNNALREIRQHRAAFGNEFDKAPYFDPESDHRD